MRKGCLLWLLQAAVLAGFYYLAFRGRVTQPAAGLSALGGGVSLLLVIGAFRQAWLARRERAQLDRVLAGAPYEDGQRIAAVGPILALGAPVPAPFSGDPCVFCAWEVSHKSLTQGKKPFRNVKDFSGFLLAPCVVQAPTGNLRILGFPALEGFPNEAQRNKTDFPRARTYLESTPFEKVSAPKAFSEVEDLVENEHGHLRRDWRMAGDDFVLNPKMHTLEEKIVNDGETVCAFGRYSAEKKGLVPGFGSGLKLIRGDGKAVRETLTDCIKGFAALGVLFFLISHFVLLLNVKDHSSEGYVEATLEPRAAAFFKAVEEGDLATVKAELDAGFDPNTRNLQNYTPLMVVKDPRVARRLISAGADVNARDEASTTPLIEAAKTCNLEMVRLLLQSGADVHVHELAEGRNALDHALQADWADDHDEVVTALRNAGAKERSP